MEVNNSLCIFPQEAEIIQKFGMEFHALLNMDGPGSKKKSKMTGVVFHPVRPWVAAVESKDFGIVWNYETKEIIKRFTLQIGDDTLPVNDKREDLNSAVAMTKTMATTFSPKLGASKPKTVSLLMFFDRESISYASGIARGIDCFEEWLIILTLNNIVFCDINDPQANRCVSSDELGRAIPNSIEMLPGGYLAIGCSDGKIRIWSPHLWKVCHVIDMGAIRDIPHMILVPSVSETNASSSTTNQFHCYLISLNQDGRAIVWSINHLNNEFQQSRACEFDMRDANKRIDLTTCGFYEMKLLLEDSILTAISKDGNVLMWDISYLRSTSLTKDPSVHFLGAFHSISTSLRPHHGTIFLGTSKQTYVYISCYRTSMLNVSELAKGKCNQDMELSAHRFDASKDVRNLHSKISKKIKINTVTQNPRSVNMIAAATNYGLLLFNLNSFTRNTATLFPSLSIITLNTPTHVRSVPLTEHGKKEMYALKQSTKDSMSWTLKHPHENYLAVVNGHHYEILHVDSSQLFRQIVSGRATQVAWHSKSLRFAIMIGDDEAGKRMKAVIAVDSPRRKVGFFGKMEEIVASGPVLSHFYKHEVNLLPHKLAIFEINQETGNCACLMDKTSLNQHGIIHLFTGPLLGIVSCVIPEDIGKGKNPPGSQLVSTTPSNIEGTITGSSITSIESTTGMYTYLEFYEWDNFPMKKIGISFASPLSIVWEKSNRYGALVYPKQINIIRWDGNTITNLHLIQCTRSVQSTLWVHHTLFTATEDEIQCYFICGSRFFSFCVASTTCFHENVMETIRLAEFPVAQRHPGGLLRLLGVYNEQLFLSGHHQSIYSVNLKNEILQFCMLVSQGQPKRALEFIPHISTELLDWLASFLEAFGFPADALQIHGISLHLKVSICIKHMLVHTLSDILPALFDYTVDDSLDILGTSMFQRACAALKRGGHEAASLAFFPPCIQSKKLNDAFYIASISNDKSLMAQALAMKEEYGLAFHANAKSLEVQSRWNNQLEFYTSTHSIRPAQVTGTWS